MRILLVEDDENTQALITATLKSNDPSVEVEWEVNGNDALTRYVERGPYDLVLTDYAHPGLLGDELIAAIRTCNIAQAIVLQTGNAGEHIERFKQQWKDIPLLQKPFSRKQLLDVQRIVNPY